MRRCSRPLLTSIDNQTTGRPIFWLLTRAHNVESVPVGGSRMALKRIKICGEIPTGVIPIDWIKMAAIARIIAPFRILDPNFCLKSGITAGNPPTDFASHLKYVIRLPVNVYNLDWMLKEYRGTTSPFKPPTPADSWPSFLPHQLRVPGRSVESKNLTWPTLKALWGDVSIIFL